MTVVAQLGDRLVLVGGLVSFVLVFLGLQSVQIVDAYERHVLTVRGEVRAVLGPGIHFLAPLVSRTYAFDVRTHEATAPVEAETPGGVPVETTVTFRATVEDPETTFRAVEDWQRGLLVRVQEAATETLRRTDRTAVLGASGAEEVERAVERELDRAAEEWGLAVEGVTATDVEPAEGAGADGPAADAGDTT